MTFKTTVERENEEMRSKFLNWDKDAKKLRTTPDDFIFFTDDLLEQAMTNAALAVIEEIIKLKTEAEGKDVVMLFDIETIKDSLTTKE